MFSFGTVCGQVQVQGHRYVILGTAYFNGKAVRVRGEKQNHQMGGVLFRSQRVRVNAAVSSPIITNTGDPVVRERYPSNFIHP